MDIWQVMKISRDELGKGTNVHVRIGGDVDDLARDMAAEMAQLIRDNNAAGRGTCAIVPVGPVGQYKYLVETITDESLDCSRVTFINMDEYLGDDGDLISADHPLSFRGFMQRAFYDRLPGSANFQKENQIVPDPRNCAALQAIIAQRGGVDVCFGGIGLNGHLAFNEPQDDMDVDAFAQLPARTLTNALESRAHMAINLSCSLDLIPCRAVTVGMKEILGARRLSFAANRVWQRGVVRQLLHGPVTPHFPASYLQRHADAHLAVADFVAEDAEVKLQ